MVLAPSCRLMFASTISLDHLKMPDGKRGRDPLNSGWGARIPLSGLQLMDKMGAVINNTETIAFDLLRGSDHPAFKVISAAVK